MKKPSRRPIPHALLTIPVAALMLGASQSQAMTSIGINFWGSYGYADSYAGRIVSGTAFGVPAANWGTSYTPANPADPSTFTYDSYTTGGSFVVGGVGIDYVDGGNFFTGSNPTNSPDLSPGETDVVNGYIHSGGTSGPGGGPGFVINLSSLNAAFPDGYVVRPIVAAPGDHTSFESLTITAGASTTTSTFDELHLTGGYYATGARWSVGTPSPVLTSDTLSVTGGDGSNLAALVVTDKPVFVNTHPMPVKALVGQTLTLNSDVIGIGTITYQWRKGGVPISGATDETYTFSPLDYPDAGEYDVVATSDAFPGTPVIGPAHTVQVNYIWGGTVDGNWDVNTTPNWTDASGNPAVYNGTSDVLFDYSGATNNVILNTTLSPANVAFDGFANYTLDGTGSLGGTTALSKSGSNGSLTMSLVNTFTGNTFIGNAGVLTVTGAGTLGAATYPGDITNNGSLVIDSSADQTFTGSISGPGTLTKSGSGYLVLAGTNSWATTTVVNGGTLEVQSKNGGDTPYVIGANGALKIGYNTSGAYENVAMTIHGNGAASTTGLYLMGGTRYNVGNAMKLVDAPTTIRQYGTGLAGLGIYDINSPGLVCTAAASGSVVDANIQFVSVAYGMTATVETGANNTTGDLTFNGPLNVVSTAGLGFYKKGSGSLLLNAPASVGNEAVRVTEGRLLCGATNVIGSQTNLLVYDNGTVVLNGTSQTVKKLDTGDGSSAGGRITGGSATLSTLTVNPDIDTHTTVADSTYGGIIGGPGTNENNLALVKAGTHTLTLRGASTYTGSTTISGGTLSVTKPYFADGADVILAAGTTLNLNTGAGVADAVSNFVINGVPQAAGYWGAVGSGAAHESSAITGSGMLYVTLGNPYLFIPVASPAPVVATYGGSVTLTSGVGGGGGTLTYQWRKNGVDIPGATGATYTISPVSAADAATYTVVVTNSGLPGSPLTSPGQVVSVDTSMVRVWTGAVNSTWDIGTTANWLAGGVSATYDPSVAAGFDDTAANRTVTLGVTVSPPGVTFATSKTDYTLGGSGAIGGSATLTKSGTGTATISTVNTFTGATTINAGTLKISGSGSLGAGNYSGAITDNGAFAYESSADQVLSSITGTGTVSKAGAGTLSVSAGSWTGLTTAASGTLVISAKSVDSPYEIAAGGTLKLAYSTGGGYPDTGMTIHGNGAAAATGLYLAGGVLYNVGGTVTLADAPTTIRQYGSGYASLGIFDVNSTGLVCTTAASGSVIDSNVQFSDYGYGMALRVDAGANIANGDLIMNGPLNIYHEGYGLFKKGTGSLRLNAAASSVNEGLSIFAGSVLCGIDDAVGANADLTVKSGATMALLGTTQHIKKLSDAGALVGRSSTLSTLVVSPGVQTSGSMTGGNLPDSTFSGVIGGTGTNENNLALVKDGPNVLTLTGANTYTGSTTVSAGTLSVSTPFFADAADVKIAAGATLNLNTGTTDTIHALYLDGVAQAVGVWGSAASGAAHQSAAFTGTGTLTVTSDGSGSAYDTWASGYGLTGSNALAGADPDHDGIPNAIEFVIGGNPASVSNSALLPTVSNVTADVGNGSTSYMKFTFRRTAESAYLGPVVQYNTNLSSTWNTAVNGTGGVVITTASGTPDLVSVYIPTTLAPGGKLFARLSVTVP